MVASSPVSPLSGTQVLKVEVLVNRRRFRKCGRGHLLIAHQGSGFNSFWSISLHKATHCLQIDTPGLAINGRASSARVPQNEQR